MDRSNFNPDQLHEHFDRVKGNFGIELEDNGRMVKLPTGHRLVVGHSTFSTSDDPSESDRSSMRLLTEVGQIGRLNLTDETASVELFNIGNIDRNQTDEEGVHGFIDKNVPILRNMHFLPLHAPEEQLDQTTTRTSGYGDQEVTTINPSADYIQKSVEESMRWADKSPRSNEDPGIFDVLRVRSRKNAGSLPIKSIGSFSMNRKSGRFEQVPD